jgi:hypothetical protein
VDNCIVWLQSSCALQESFRFFRLVHGNQYFSVAEVGVRVVRLQLERPITLFELYYMGSQNVAFPDVKTLGRLTGLLQASGKSHRILGESSTTFADLRNGPVVLIGAFNNDWTMRLMGPMRFSFERDNNTFWIKNLQESVPQRPGRQLYNAVFAGYGGLWLAF